MLVQPAIAHICRNQPLHGGHGFLRLHPHAQHAAGARAGGVWIYFDVATVAGGCEPEEFSRYPLWRGVLIYLIGVPVLTVVMAALAYGNYKRVLVGWSAWRRNLLTLAISLALVICATAAIYHRAWELLGNIEPPHGMAQLTQAQTRMQVNGQNITVILPDGRVWMDRYAWFEVNPFTTKLNGKPDVWRRKISRRNKTGWTRRIAGGTSPASSATAACGFLKNRINCDASRRLKGKCPHPNPPSWPDLDMIKTGRTSSGQYLLCAYVEDKWHFMDFGNQQLAMEQRMARPARVPAATVGDEF